MTTMTDEMNAYTLARMADCATPDSIESAGARFLLSVLSDYQERKEYGPVDDDVIHEIADEAPDVYTAARWAEFVDLGGYNEDITELGEVDGNDLTRSVAGVALYMIAERLLRALIEEDETTEDEEDSDED